MSQIKWFDHTIILLILTISSSSVSGLKCYCTDDHCVPYGSCDGSVCLVGILRDSNQVIRTCGTTTLGCHKNEDDKWTDLCACDQPFCNTFAFLRSHTRRTAASSSASSSASAFSNSHHQPSSSFDSSRQEDHNIPSAGGQVHHDSPLVFHRVDRPDDGSPLQTSMDREHVTTKTSLLTLLLVVVPLTVGAATVMVVAFNYYCHLC